MQKSPQSQLQPQGTQRLLSHDEFSKKLNGVERQFIDATPGWNIDLFDREAKLTIRDRFSQSATFTVPFTQASIDLICRLRTQYRNGTLIAASVKSDVEAMQIQRLVDEEHLRRRGFPREGRYQDS